MVRGGVGLGLVGLVGLVGWVGWDGWLGGWLVVFVDHFFLLLT